MAIPAVRIIAPPVERNFGRFGDAAPVPPLTDIQTRSYDRGGNDADGRNGQGVTPYP